MAEPDITIDIHELVPRPGSIDGCTIFT